MPAIKNTQHILNDASGLLQQTKIFSTADDLQSGDKYTNGFMKGKMLHKLDKLSNSVRNESHNKNQFYTNFRKSKRTASVADSQQKRGFSNSVNIGSNEKENAYRYMSVTPSHKFHETKKNKLLMVESPAGFNANLLKTSPQRIKYDAFVKSSFVESPTYKNNPSIEEVKDEYNDSKLSFNQNEASGDVRPDSKRALDIDIEAMILVEDRIGALNTNVSSEYWEVTNVVYKKIDEQLDLLAGDIKHIKTLKICLILEYIAVL